ncbi:coil containing protein [Vibrio phage 1.077.O._10N.261.45.A10]|nr:coil containing protein [Vibrio phage 1.077.O._10N.261.45.A10]
MPITPEEFEASLDPQAQVETGFDFSDAISSQRMRGDSISRLYAGQAAMVRGAPTDNATMEIDALQPDSKEVRKQVVNDYYRMKQQELTQWADREINNSPESAHDVLDSTIAGQNLFMERQASVLSDELVYATQAAPDGVPELRDQQAFLLGAMNDLNEIVDSQGWLDDAFDFAGLMVPFGEALDIQDVATEIGKNPELAQVAGANLEEVVMNWHSLPAARKQMLYPLVQDAVIEATKTSLFGIESDGNLLKASGILQELLDPEGAGALREAQALDVALGAVDVVPIGAVTKMAKLSALEKANVNVVLKGAVDTARAENTAAKVAANAGDVNAAATHTVTAMTDPAVANSMNTTKLTAALDAMPIETGDWFREVISDDQLPGAVARKLNDAAVRAQGFARSLTTESEFMKIGALSGTERQAVVDNFLQQMDKVGEDYLVEGLELANLKLTKRNNEGFSYSYELSAAGDPSPGALRTGEVTFKINDVTGTFSATVNDPIAQQTSKILSPAAFSKTGSTGDFNAEVKRSIQSSDLAAAIDARAAEMLVWAAEPVSGVTGLKARGRVEDVLEAGDEFVNPSTQITGRVFTPTELAAGIETHKGTVRLTAPAEQEAYYRMRMYSDAAFQTENYVLRREMELGGMKQVKMFTAAVPTDAGYNVRNGATSVGKPLADANAARASLADKQGWGVWDDTQQRVIDITDSYIDDVYDNGELLVRLRKDWNSKGTGDLDASGEMVSYVRVKASRVSDLPEQVLHYKPGYVPKINRANFVAKQVVPMTKRGVTTSTRTQALRAFDSFQDANRFRDEQVVKFMRENPQAKLEDAELIFPAVSKFEDLTTAERLEDAVGSHGGLFHGTRSKDELLFGLSGQRLERASPYEAFQRQVGHLGTFVARNEVRVGAEKRWINTVRREYPNLKLTGFDGTAVPTTTAKGKMLNELRQQIKEWNGIPSREENMYQGAIQSLHDWGLNGIRQVPFGMRDKESIKSLQWLKNTNPITAIKGAVMHNLLGALNPAQVYTQASAALVAASKFPLTSPKNFERAFMFHALDNIRNTTALGKVYKMVGKGDFSEGLTDAHDAWKRTGLYESVFNNVDTAAIASNGLGVASSVMRNAGNASLWFYRAGELFNRRFSFLQEYENWVKVTGRTKPNDDELQEILVETNKNMLELNAANRAYWQGGYGTGPIRQIAGMATQFMQVTAKTLELALKGEGRGGFTSAQRARIVAGQVALFGAAGIPLGSVAVSGVASWTGLREVDDTTASVINQGFVGTSVNMMFGSDLEISNRFALGGSVTQLVKDLMSSEDPMVIKAFGPAAGGLGGRTWEALKELQVLFGGDRAGMDELDETDMKMAASVLSRIPSTGRSMYKAWLMANTDKIVDRRHNVVVRRDFDYWTEIGTAMGFQPSDEVRTRMLQWSNRETEEMIQELVNTRVSLMHRAIFVEKLDGEKVKAYTAAMQMLDETMPEYVKAQVRQRVTERLFGEDRGSTEEREIRKFIEQTAADKISEDAIIDAGFTFGNSDMPIIKPFSKLLDQPQVEE